MTDSRGERAFCEGFNSDMAALMLDSVLIPFLKANLRATATKFTVKMGMMALS
jgi:hypothetical protein